MVERNGVHTRRREGVDAARYQGEGLPRCRRYDELPTSLARWQAWEARGGKRMALVHRGAVASFPSPARSWPSNGKGRGARVWSYRFAYNACGEAAPIRRNIRGKTFGGSRTRRGVPPAINYSAFRKGNGLTTGGQWCRWGQALSRSGCGTGRRLPRDLRGKVRGSGVCASLLPKEDTTDAQGGHWVGEDEV